MENISARITSGALFHMIHLNDLNDSTSKTIQISQEFFFLRADQCFKHEWHGCVTKTIVVSKPLISSRFTRPTDAIYSKKGPKKLLMWRRKVSVANSWKFHSWKLLHFFLLLSWCLATSLLLRNEIRFNRYKINGNSSNHASNFAKYFRISWAPWTCIGRVSRLHL